MAWQCTPFSCGWAEVIDGTKRNMPEEEEEEERRVDQSEVFI